jgi:hypothetical protein
MIQNNINAFFCLLRAGLWERDNLSFPHEAIDFDEIYKMAQEQCVIGLVTAGLEHVEDVKIPKDMVLSFMSYVLALEKMNSAMNNFIETMVEKMRKDKGVYTLLLKGQGIAQCYERPLWRTCGDVDFFLSEDNYIKAKEYLLPLSSSSEREGVYEKHQGMIICKWVVELHGTLRCGVSSKIDSVLDDIQTSTFQCREVRSWINGNTNIYLLRAENDALYVFAHFLNHFYIGGVGLRQICDWCRLLWTYRDSINHELLEYRLKMMGLISEWKAFGAFAVDYLGMPIEAMPLYDSNKKWSRKACRIKDFIMKVGNMGHNRDSSYYKKYPYLVRKSISLGQRIGDIANHFYVFPIDSLRFFTYIMFNGLRSAMRGE